MLSSLPIRSQAFGTTYVVAPDVVDAGLQPGRAMAINSPPETVAPVLRKSRREKSTGLMDMAFPPRKRWRREFFRTGLPSEKRRGSGSGLDLRRAADGA